MRKRPPMVPYWREVESKRPTWLLSNGHQEPPLPKTKKWSAYRVQNIGENRLLELRPQSGIRRSQRYPISLSSSPPNRIKCFQDEWLLEGENLLLPPLFALWEAIAYDWVLIQFREITVYYRCCTFLPFRVPLRSFPVAGGVGSCAAGNNADMRRVTDRCSSVSSTKHNARSPWSLCWTFALQMAKCFFTWCLRRRCNTYMLLNYYYFCY